MRNKKTPKQLKKDERNKNRGTIPVFALHDCGCCTAKMRFHSKKTALEAFSKAVLGNSIDIVDDQGVAHAGIDTFYGLK